MPFLKLDLQYLLGNSWRTAASVSLSFWILDLYNHLSSTACKITQINTSSQSNNSYHHKPMQLHVYTCVTFLLDNGTQWIYNKIKILLFTLDDTHDIQHNYTCIYMYVHHH